MNWSITLAIGVSKLVRLLYYSDCGAYILLGKPITSATDLHFPHGPYPENWHRVREQMEQSGVVTVLRDGKGEDYHRYRLLTNRIANREILSAEEVDVINEQLRRFADFSAAAIEQCSRHEIAWRATEDGEPIAYELAGIAALPLSQASIRVGLEVASAAQGR